MKNQNQLLKTWSVPYIAMSPISLYRLYRTLTLLYSGKVGELEAWQAANEISDHSFGANGKKQVITGLNRARKQEKNNMAFVNEKVSHQDKTRIFSFVTLEKVKERAKWVHRLQDPYRWTVDHDRGVYLFYLSGGGRDQLDYYALVIGDEFVVFNLDMKGLGDDTVGLKHNWGVYDLIIPLSLKSRQEEIKQLIREGLEEMAYFRPLKDGGTFDNPNTVKRGNILSFNVEFK
jgi:hypothetical protein